MPFEPMLYCVLSAIAMFDFAWVGSGGPREIWWRRNPQEIGFSVFCVLYSLWGFSFLWRF